MTQPAHWIRTRLRLLVTAGLLSAPAALYAQAPLTLFNGTSLLGWNPHGMWSATNGAITTNGSGTRSILTAVPFGDFSLQFEYNEAEPAGAKLRLWTTRDDNGGLTVDLDIKDSRAGVGGIESSSKSSITTVSPGWHRVQADASHGQLTVRIDGQPSGTASGLGARGGFIGFEAGGNGTLQVRGVRLTPLNLTSAFNGADLGGWKSIARKPDAKAGVGHTVEKTLTFGIGGGKDKPHEAKWTVRGGSIHGESGPGGLENSNMVESAIIQITASAQGDVKPANTTALSLRNSPGQLSDGYAVGVGPYAGTIEGLVKHGFGRPGTPVDETVIIDGRTIAVWVGGTLTTVHTDPRPESSNVAQGARTSAGTMTLLLPNDNQQIEVARLAVATLPKNFGAPAHAAALPPPPPQPTNPAPTQPTTPTSVAETVLVQQQQAAAKKDAADQENKQRIAGLMSQALATTDPDQQMGLYGQVVHLDPSNAAAVQGYKEAQTKVLSQQTAAANAQSSAQQQQQTDQSRKEQTNASVLQAQSAFLGGHLSEASQALSVAERLSPGNPLVRELRSRISASQSIRTRLFFLGSGMGVIALLSAFTLWMRRRRMQRNPVLEVTKGLDSGTVYTIDRDTTRIGAVAQDGGQKNDIVIRDVEHAVSRFHCEIVKQNGQLYLRDLNSSNGTRVEGTKLKPGNAELLRKGTRIQLAETVELRFGYGRSPKQKQS